MPILRHILSAILLLTMSLGGIGVHGQSSDIDRVFSGIGWDTECTNPQDCIQPSVSDLGNDLEGTGIVTDKNLTGFVNDLVTDLLKFVAIIGVVFVILAGLYLVIFSYSEEASKKARQMIIYVVVGIIVIALSRIMVFFIIDIFTGRDPETTFIPEAHAQELQTSPALETFANHQNRILSRIARLKGEYDEAFLAELEGLIDQAFTTLPDSEADFLNQNLYDEVKVKLGAYHEFQDNLSKSDLVDSVEKFIKDANVPSIQARISASPDSGNAPLAVTLEAKGVRDGSGSTVSDTNYIWWIQRGNTIEVLGRNKTLLHTFLDEGNYSVFLTINSDSRNNKGHIDVLPFENSTEITVQQPRARIFLFFDEYDASRVSTVKIPSIEAADGIIIDASATQVPNGTSIIQTTWDFGDGVISENDGSPVIEQHTYSEPGKYRVRLTLELNDGEEIKKQTDLVVGDPIASIDSGATVGYIGDNVRFRARNSKWVINVRYNWKLRDTLNGEIINRGEGVDFRHTFDRIGEYAISLEAQNDEGDIDTDVKNISIVSRAPEARFDADVLANHRPNTYILDGTGSYDPDLLGTGDLQFRWFIDGESVVLDDQAREWTIGTYTFTQKWTYHIELHVTDAQNNTDIAKQDITIDNLLSLEVFSVPEVAQRGEEITFKAIAPGGRVYEWDFGDGTDRITSQGEVTHIYAAAGEYTLNLEVNGDSGDINTIKQKVHITESNSPFALLEVEFEDFFLTPEPWVCGAGGYQVNRSEPVRFRGAGSVNTRGETSDITHLWKVGFDKNSLEDDFEYRFDEIGCFPVSLTVTSQENGRSHTSTTFIEVRNEAPRISSLSVSIEDIDTDPVIVNIRANNAQDVDGYISSYYWYYFSDLDPEPLVTRITAGPEVRLTLPKLNGQYHFGVILEDSDGARTDSGEVLESRFSTPSFSVSGDISTPIAELEVTSREITLGEPITFLVNVRNPIGQDIAEFSEYRWDFDGDGFYDQKTSRPEVTHTYTRPGEYQPRAKVLYRGRSDIAHTSIEVGNELIANASLLTLGRRIVAINTSQGTYQTVRWKIDGETVTDSPNYFIHTPENSNAQTLTLEISDGETTTTKSFELETNIRNRAIIQQVEGSIVLITNHTDPQNPDYITNSVTLEHPTDMLALYLGESKWDIANYVIDENIELDTTLTWADDDDRDNLASLSYSQGTPYTINLYPNKASQITRITLLDSDGAVIDSRDLVINFGYYSEPVVDDPDDTTEDISVSPEDRILIERIQSLISESPDSEKSLLQRHLDQLIDGWHDPISRTDELLRLQGFVYESPAIDDALKSRYDALIEEIIADGQDTSNRRTISENLIRNLIPTSHESHDDIIEWLESITDDPADYESNRAFAKRILEAIEDSDDMPQQHKNIVREQLQGLIGSAPEGVEDPNPDDVIPDTDEPEEKTGLIQTLIRILIWVIVFVIGLSGILFIVSRLRRQRDDLEFETSDDTPVDTSEDPIPAPAQEDALEEEEVKPDWLPDTPEPADEEVPDFLKDMVAPEYKEEKDATEEFLYDDNKKEEIKEKAVAEEEADVPDWLARTTTEEKEDKTETPDTQKEEVKEKEEKVAKSTPEPSPDVPDWLAGADTDETKPEETKEATEKTPEIVDTETEWGLLDFAKHDDLPKDTKDASIPEKKEEQVAKDALKEELPDWLAGANKEESPQEEVGTAPAPKVIEETTIESQDKPDVPDWLKWAEDADTKPENEPETIDPEPSEPTPLTVAPKEAPKKDEATPAIPSWLAESTPDPDAAPTEPKSSGSEIPDWLTKSSETKEKVTKKNTDKKKKKETQANEEVNPDVPDWLLQSMENADNKDNK